MDAGVLLGDQDQTQRLLGDYGARIRALEDSNKKILDEFREVRRSLAEIAGAQRLQVQPPGGGGDHGNGALALSMMALADAIKKPPAAPPQSELVQLVREMRDAAVSPAKTNTTAQSALAMVGLFALGGFVVWMVLTLKGFGG